MFNILVSGNQRNRSNLMVKIVYLYAKEEKKTILWEKYISVHFKIIMTSAFKTLLKLFLYISFSIIGDIQYSVWR